MGDVVDLCDSDEETPVAASGVARMPSNRIRAMADEDYDSDVVIVDSPESNRKRPRAALKGGDDTDGIEVIQVKERSSLPPTPLAQVLSIFPDVALHHAKDLLKKNHDNHEVVINALIEGGAYPREPRKQPTAASGSGSGLFTMKSSQPKPTYNFLDVHSFIPTQQYVNQSIEQLQHLFPCLTKAGAVFALKKSGNHFAIAHNRLVRALKGKERGKPTPGMGNEDEEEINQYKKLKACTDNKACFNQEQKDEFQSLFGSTPKKTYFSTRPRPKEASVTDPILVEELCFVREKLRNWTDGIETNIARKENREMSIKDGTCLECACCYDQTPMEELIQCREGHLFCQDCLASYVENQVFSNGNFGYKPGTKELATELMCFHGDGCGSGFDRFFLDKALKEKVLERYDELQSQVNLEKAGLRDTICTCPKCGFTAEVPSTQAVFSCLNLDCKFESCRKCREASHIPLRCEEVEKKSESEGRTRVEEAASAAVIRFCPKCKKGILKEDGCNKMTCPCGVKFCYLCRAVVKDYSHFCQVPHCEHNDPRKCSNKCPLYTKDLDAVHEKNMREAAVAEAAKVAAESASRQQPKKVGLFGGDGEAQPAAKVSIDVESILQAPAKRRRAY